ncbi:MAG: type II toxin-antitoxin system HicA family toxin [Firmicutes bacterium]|nr:type II toxin-antitoxin system HicA family toxin [Bacillota bacterium]
MSQWEKLLARIRRHPKTVTFDELDILLQRAGFVRRQPRSGSSHYVYIKGNRILTVPKHSPYVKAVYVKQALKVLDEEGPES